MNKHVGPNLGQRVIKHDPIIDRSPEQKRLRMQKLKAELAELGYSVVETAWLQDVLHASKVRDNRRKYLKFEYSEQAAG